jgi:hypothetical protein
MVISIVLVGVSLVAALNMVGASKQSEQNMSVKRDANLLAQELMSEILSCDYADAVEGADSFGLTGLKSATGNRSLFDDVDDYHGWSASPPQDKAGNTYADLPDWQRTVAVVWADPTDTSKVVGSNQGIKKITVNVLHKGIMASSLTALRTVGLPPLEACCFGDGSCADLRTAACTAKTGTAQGPDTMCARTECPTGPTVLFVVADPDKLTSGEQDRQALMTSWGYSVDLIGDYDTRANFDAAAASADVAYVGETINYTLLGTKLTLAAIGVVNEEVRLIDEFGLASGSLFAITLTDASITDNTHYITSSFAEGDLTLSSPWQPFYYVNGGVAVGVQQLATVFNKPSLLIADTGAELLGGAPASGRRVQLPWGSDGFDFGAVNGDAHTIMERAIEWAAERSGAGAVCGDTACDPGEDSCNCPADCGPPAAIEEAGVTCDDGLDNDCDGDTDCADITCAGDLACSCGNSLCEPGEDCNSCPGDCASVTGGNPANRYCCGNGTAEAAEGDGTICDGNY